MKLFEKIDKTIFGTSSAIYVLIFLFIAIVPTVAFNVISGVMNYTLSTLGWVYIVGYVAVFLVLGIIALSKYGKMKLGAPTDKPEFSFFSWISMLVGAGIGCGLVYFGVCEPASHFTSSPFADSGTTAAAEVAIRTTFYHWGFLPWAIYCMVGLCVGYFSYKKGLPDLISSSFQPLLGDRIYKTPARSSMPSPLWPSSAAFRCPLALPVPSSPVVSIRSTVFPTTFGSLSASSS